MSENKTWGANALLEAAVALRDTGRIVMQGGGELRVYCAPLRISIDAEDPDILMIETPRAACIAGLKEKTVQALVSEGMSQEAAYHEASKAMEVKGLTAGLEERARFPLSGGWRIVAPRSSREIPARKDVAWVGADE